MHCWLYTGVLHYKQRQRATADRTVHYGQREREPEVQISMVMIHKERVRSTHTSVASCEALDVTGWGCRDATERLAGNNVAEDHKGLIKVDKHHLCLTCRLTCVASPSVHVLAVYLVHSQVLWYVSLSGLR